MRSPSFYPRGFTRVWVDQETGWALARDILLIPINIGLQPYGFVGRYQSLPGAGNNWEAVPDRILDLLLPDTRIGAQIVEGLVHQFESTDSYDEARWNFDLLRRAQAFTPDQSSRIERAYKDNDQLRDAWHVQDRIDTFLGEHWLAHSETASWSEPESWTEVEVPPEE
jgi:hypothetical protein